MRIISFMAIKGGVGKTIMAYQLAKYAQIKKKQVLLIDFDSANSIIIRTKIKKGPKQSLTMVVVNSNQL